MKEDSDADRRTDKTNFIRTPRPLVKKSDQTLNKTLITLTWQKREGQVRILVQIVARTRLGQELKVHGR